CGARYRQHPDSSVAVVKKTGQYPAARLNFLNWVEEYLSKQGSKDAEIWQVLRKELRPYRHPVLHHLSGRAQLRMAQMKELLKVTARLIVPAQIRRWLRVQWSGEIR